MNRNKKSLLDTRTLTYVVLVLTVAVILTWFQGRKHWQEMENVRIEKAEVEKTLKEERKDREMDARRIDELGRKLNEAADQKNLAYAELRGANEKNDSLEEERDRLRDELDTLKKPQREVAEAKKEVLGECEMTTDAITGEEYTINPDCSWDKRVERCQSILGAVDGIDMLGKSIEIAKQITSPKEVRLCRAIMEGVGTIKEVRNEWAEAEKKSGENLMNARSLGEELREANMTVSDLTFTRNILEQTITWHWWAHGVSLLTLVLLVLWLRTLARKNLSHAEQYLAQANNAKWKAERECNEAIEKSSRLASANSKLMQSNKENAEFAAEIWAQVQYQADGTSIKEPDSELIKKLHQLVLAIVPEQQAKALLHDAEEAAKHPKLVEDKAEGKPEQRPAN